MSAFTGLYWKELKISRVDFLIALVLMIVMFLAAVSGAHYYKEPLFFAVPAIMIFAVHIWYLPLFLFSSLRNEGKTQLWLHNPHSGALLFSVKFASVFTYYFISLFISFLCALWGFEYITTHLLPPEFHGLGLKALLLMGLFITAMGIYMAVWLQFYWSLYHAMKNIPYLKKIRWFIIFFLWISLSLAGEFIRTHFFYGKLNEIGVIQIQVLQEVRFEVDRTAAEVLPAMGTIDISIVTILFYILVTAIVFSLSVWLLERKVEV